jgi:hypothetical protein
MLWKPVPRQCFIHSMSCFFLTCCSMVARCLCVMWASPAARHAAPSGHRGSAVRTGVAWQQCWWVFSLIFRLKCHVWNPNPPLVSGQSAVGAWGLFISLLPTKHKHKTVCCSLNLQIKESRLFYQYLHIPIYVWGNHLLVQCIITSTSVDYPHHRVSPPTFRGENVVGDVFRVSVYGRGGGLKPDVKDAIGRSEERAASQWVASTRDWEREGREHVTEKEKR